MFEELALRHPRRAKTAAGAMSALASRMSIDPLFEAYDFSTLGPSATLVDIGGAQGPVSLALVKRFPSLKCIVQDLPEAIAAGKAKREDLSEDVKSRVEYQVHDFFEEQPVKDADAYFYRAVFHDWPDKYCVKILRALTPALKKGAKIILNEALMPEPGTLPPPLERLFRARDLNMMFLFNARERLADNWKDLFAQADKRFKFQGIKKPSKGAGPMPPVMFPSVIEATWEP